MKSYLALCFLFVFALLTIGCEGRQSVTTIASDFPILPTPQKITYGTAVVFFDAFRIVANDFKGAEVSLINFFNTKAIFQNEKGIAIHLIKAEATTNTNEEWYTLVIADEITITATTRKGAYYGLQSLQQLVRNTTAGATVPKLNIEDWPAFKLRGFMHDTGRNFQSVAQLKEQIDLLAFYKYNVFHWHITDNPGWRLESKKYPELQSAASMTRRKGEFYTQDDFKEISAYCKARQITLIPELDIPGHTAAFRKAFGLETMNDTKVLPILLDLFDELMGLASAQDMPYIHMGTDEVRHKEERVSDTVILKIMERIRENNREVIVWKEGIVIQEDSTSINQLWAQFEGREGHRFIDSRSNYINHLDPFAGMARLFFQQPCRQPQGDALALGGILCAWPDNNVAEERDILRQNPIYPSLVFYADAIWKGRKKNYPEYWAKLPHKGSERYDEFKAFEAKVIQHRDLFFKDKEFPYVKQTDIEWNLIGPFDHQGDLTESFEVETGIKNNYVVADKAYSWEGPYVGGTIHLNHFFGFPSITDKKSGTYYAYTEIFSPNTREQDFWIGFHGWSRAGGRRGGPTAALGQWHTTNPKIWVNDLEVAPPAWQQPNLGVQSAEIPFVDEDYFYRTPTKIMLNKGWNKVLLKIPFGGSSWKWMFTCVPVNVNGKNVTEVGDLKFRAKLIRDGFSE